MTTARTVGLFCLGLVLTLTGTACRDTAGSAEDTPSTDEASAAGVRGDPGRRAGADGGPANRQVAEAVLAAPPSMRAGAGVIGYDDGGSVVRLREPSNSLLCLADDPSDDRFQVACYHRDLEPFMARGRELRARGVSGPRVDSVRNREIREGKLAMPDHPAALYNLGAPTPPADPAGGQVEGAHRLTVLYVPGAEPDDLGLPNRPAGGLPWLMAGGTPKAHVMFAP